MAVQKPNSVDEFAETMQVNPSGEIVLGPNDTVKDEEKTARDCFQKDLQEKINRERNIIEGRLHVFISDNEHFQSIAAGLLAMKTPEAKQKFLEEEAQKIAQKILPYVESPEMAGALLNFKYSPNPEKFKKQIFTFLWNLDDAIRKDAFKFSEIADLGPELYNAYSGHIQDVRKKLALLVQEKLGDGKTAPVLGDYLGYGGIGNVYNGSMGGEPMALKLHHQGMTERAMWKEGVEENLKEACKSSANLMGYFGSMILGKKTGDNWGRRADFFEEVPDAVNGDEYLESKGVITLNLKNESHKEIFYDYLEKIFQPALNGVKALHRRGLVHRDLKNQNILISEGEKERKTVKVSDYDLVCKNGFEEQDKTIAVGTPVFMSPEQCVNDPITDKSDIYSLGKMLYELVGGEIARGNVAQAINQTVSGEYNVKNLEIPNELKLLIFQCLDTDPKKRPDIGELIERIKVIADRGKASLRPIQEAGTAEFFAEGVEGSKESVAEIHDTIREEPTIDELDMTLQEGVGHAV